MHGGSYCTPQEAGHIATYTDDWLLASASHQGALENTQLLLQHLERLGFRVNQEKSVLTPSQRISFIGLTLDSVSLRAHLSVERVDAFLACLALFRRGKWLPFRTCLRLLGLMASAKVIIPLGRLYMRGLQCWVASLGLDRSRHGHCCVRVTVECMAALYQWKLLGFLTQGIPVGPVLTRKVVTTDASLQGWGATHEL